MRELGVDFVLLAPAVTSLDVSTTEETAVSGQAKATAARASTALDANPLLVGVGITANGQLWAFDRGTSEVPAAAAIPANAGGIWRILVLVVQGVVVGLALLMSLPTRRSADRVAELNARRPNRRGGRGAAKAVEPEPVVEPEDVVETAEPESPANESLAAYEAEPADEAAVESAAVESAAVETIDDPATSAEEPPPADIKEHEQEQAPESQPTPEPGPHPVADPDDGALEAEAAPAPAFETDPASLEHTTPRETPTTLEEGLDETIIRPRRGPDGGAHG